MANDSTITDSISRGTQKLSPRLTTVNLIRQLARSYVVVSGLALNGIICN